MASLVSFSVSYILLETKDNIFTFFVFSLYLYSYDEIVSKFLC